MKKILILFVFAFNFCSAQNLNRCSHYLIDNYFHSPFDKNLFKEVHTVTDHSVVFTDMFQVVQNEAKDRFIAFFVTLAGAGTNDSYFLVGQTLKYTGYTITALKYNDKWFFQKGNIMNFSENTIDEGRKFYFCETLLQLRFTNCIRKRPRPDFWNENTFSDLKIEKWWNQSDLEINRAYLGLPKIVASNLKDTFAANKKREDLEVYTKYILPHLELLKQNKEYEYVSSNSMSAEFILIYPPDKNTIIYPIFVKRYNDTTHELRFYALLKNGNIYEKYEWHYFAPVKYRRYSYNFLFYETINTLTYWTYIMPFISDEKFWSEYVTKSQDNSYVYLKRVD